MERKVTIKQRVVEKTWTDENGATLTAVRVHSNTSGEKDFEVKAELELIFPARAPFRKNPLRSLKMISGEDAAGFEDAAARIVKIVQARSLFPPTSPRPHTELSTPFVTCMTIGSFKQPDKPTVYFLEVDNGNDPLRFSIGDQEQLEELRYFFRQVNDFHQSICQQR